MKKKSIITFTEAIDNLENTLANIVALKEYSKNLLTKFRKDVEVADEADKYTSKEPSSLPEMIQTRIIAINRAI